MSSQHDQRIVATPPPGKKDTPRNASLPSSEPSTQWVALSLEEYKSLRAEIIDAIQAQRQIMQIGITGLSVLIGLGLQRIDPLLAVLLLIILVPILAAFVTAGALGEFFRAARASSFLAYREEILNRSAPGPALAQEWEQWLRRKPIFTVRDWAQFLAMHSINTCALILGFYTMFTSKLHVDLPTLLILTLAAASLVLWTASPMLHIYLLRRARHQFFQKESSPAC